MNGSPTILDTHATQATIEEISYLHVQAFKRVKYGGIRVRLKDISQAIQYKSKSNKSARDEADNSNKILPMKSEHRRSDYKGKKYPPRRCDTVNDLAPLVVNDTKRNSASESPNSHINSDSESNSSAVSEDDSNIMVVDYKPKM